MRQFIRHPSDIPISYKLGVLPAGEGSLLSNISEGGLAFHNAQPIEVGSYISIDVPSIDYPYETEGRVVWCQKCSDEYLIGVQFDDASNAFQARMVEQICHIEHYRRKILREEGRELTSEEAAQEWIACHAADFPN